VLLILITESLLLFEPSISRKGISFRLLRGGKNIKRKKETCRRHRRLRPPTRNAIKLHLPFPSRPFESLFAPQASSTSTFNCFRAPVDARMIPRALSACLRREKVRGGKVKLLITFANVCVALEILFSQRNSNRFSSNPRRRR
jgi:hypothetical protein